MPKQNPFTYCPKCAAAALKYSSPKSVLCTECGFEYFFNSAAAVLGIIFNERGELLVTVRANEPARGKLDFPGGFVDPGETAEHALVREIKEELNLDVDSMDYFASAVNDYRYKGVIYPTLDIAFTCCVRDFSTLKLQDEIDRIRMIKPDNINPDEFAFTSTGVFIAMFNAG